MKLYIVNETNKSALTAFRYFYLFMYIGVHSYLLLYIYLVAWVSTDLAFTSGTLNIVEKYKLIYICVYIHTYTHTQTHTYIFAVLSIELRVSLLLGK
jgi:hypothetical protein